MLSLWPQKLHILTIETIVLQHNMQDEHVDRQLGLRADKMTFTHAVKQLEFTLNLAEIPLFTYIKSMV